MNICSNDLQHEKKRTKYIERKAAKGIFLKIQKTVKFETVTRNKQTKRRTTKYTTKMYNCYKKMLIVKYQYVLYGVVGKMKK